MRGFVVGDMSKICHTWSHDHDKSMTSQLRLTVKYMLKYSAYLRSADRSL